MDESNSRQDVSEAYRHRALRYDLVVKLFDVFAPSFVLTFDKSVRYWIEIPNFFD